MSPLHIQSSFSIVGNLGKRLFIWGIFAHGILFHGFMGGGGGGGPGFGLGGPGGPGLFGGGGDQGNHLGCLVGVEVVEGGNW